ncbi:MAG: endo-1,3-alpha-glucanase family glycosylhydrolase [Kiritimatiellia bacterium]|jgi:hypothetical protein
MKKICLLACLLALVSRSEAVERKFFAHYMGCFPVSSGWLPVSLTNGFEKIRSGAAFEEPGGAGWLDRPLQPWGFQQGEAENADFEIRRAMRAGLDGFAVDAWAGRDGAKRTFEALLKAAEKYDGKFQVTICLDPACHRHGYDDSVPMWRRFADSVNDVLRFADSPAFATFDGRPLIFTYHMRFVAGWGPFPEIEEQWKSFRKAISRDVFLHGDIDYLVKWDDPEADKVGAVRFAAGLFDALGGFIGEQGNWGLDPLVPDTVKACGKIWSQPMICQYQNPRGSIITYPGLDRLAACWENAIQTDSRLIQFVTWNDYGEETSLAPNVSWSYTLTRLCKYWSDWWKNGKPPKVAEDEIHLVFRRTDNWDTPSWPFSSRNRNTLPPPVLEVVTLLKKPATVEVDGYGGYKAPAGLFRKQFPLKAGTVRARARRTRLLGTKTVCGITAPEKVADAPFREDFMMYAIGSNYDSEWEKDFPGVPPVKWAYQADEDNDGMPNWFEMLFFGRFHDMSTASCADPAADPDGDGADNLEEYRRRTNPLVADEPYSATETWSSADIARKAHTWNPMRDSRGNDVWYALRPDGRRATVEGGQMTARWFYDGNFHFTTNGTVTIAGRRGDTYALGWKAPAGGTYEIAADVSVSPEAAGGGEIWARLEAATESREVRLGKGSHETITLPPVRLQAGDMVKLVSDLRDMWGVGPLEIQELRVRRNGN